MKNATPFIIRDVKVDRIKILGYFVSNTWLSESRKMISGHERSNRKNRQAYHAVTRSSVITHNRIKISVFIAADYAYENNH